MLKKALQPQARDLLLWRSYLSIIHHIPGRIRVRISGAFREAARDRDISQLQAIWKRIPGIRNLRPNLRAASAVIEYDPAVIEPAVWEQLIHGSEETAAPIIDAFLRRWYANVAESTQEENHVRETP